jgi:Spy/CpxP family protein refolding chaperone
VNPATDIESTLNGCFPTRSKGKILSMQIRALYFGTVLLLGAASLCCVSATAQQKAPAAPDATNSRQDSADKTFDRNLGRRHSDGFRYARPAIDAGYPTAMQAVAFSGELSLSEGQRARVWEIDRSFVARAVELELVLQKAEQDISKVLLTENTDDVRLAELMAPLERAHNALRLAYFRYHLDIGAVLSADQRQAFRNLRDKTSPHQKIDRPTPPVAGVAPKN